MLHINFSTPGKPITVDQVNEAVTAFAIHLSNLQSTQDFVTACKTCTGVISATIFEARLGQPPVFKVHDITDLILVERLDNWDLFIKVLKDALGSRIEDVSRVFDKILLSVNTVRGVEYKITFQYSAR
jgi:bacterioferritin-associated ferredoxin